MKRFSMFCLIMMLILGARICFAQEDPVQARNRRIQGQQGAIQERVNAEIERSRHEAATKLERAKQELAREKEKMGEEFERAKKEMGEVRKEIDSKLQMQRDEIQRGIANRERSLMMDRLGDIEDTPTSWLKVKWTEQQLFRGDSFTYEGVTVTWEFTELDKATTSSLGRLKFSGGQKSIVMELGPRSFVLVNEVRQGKRVVGTSLSRQDQYAYLSPAAFTIRADIAGELSLSSDVRNLRFTCHYQPDQLGATGASYGILLSVSKASPVTIQQQRWSISDRPKKYPDGTEMEQMEIRDEAGKLKAELPLTDGAFVQSGRYHIEVQRYLQDSGTVVLKVQADIDKSIKGRWAYIDFYVRPSITIETFLNELAEKGGFKVVWAPAPGHPESIDVIKRSANLRVGGSAETINHFVKDNLERNPVNFEWLSDTELKVSPRDYDKVVARQEEAKKVQEAQDAIRKKFDTEYQLMTLVYSVQNMDPNTAGELINRELHKYYLIRTNGELKIMRDDDEPYLNQAVLKQVQESSIFDNKSKAIIVKALPATQEKVAALLKQIGSALNVPDTASMSVFQIEAILLRGNGDGNSTMPGYLTAKDLEALGVKKVTEIGRAVVQLAGEKSELGRASVTLGGGYGVELAFQDYRRPYVVLRGSLVSGMAAPKPAVESASAAMPQTTFTLKRGEEKEFQRAVFRLIRTDRPRPQLQDPRSDYAEIAIIFNGQAGEEILSELKTEMIYGEFEVTVEDVSPVLGKNGESNGEGTARLRIRHIPPQASRPAKGEKEPGKTQLLENTVFLERDKPAFLGLTNMREALILVLRWKEK